MKWLLLIFLFPLAASAGPDPYDSLTLYAGDTHVHPGNSGRLIDLSDLPIDVGPPQGVVDIEEVRVHSYGTVADVCARSAANGADFMVASHHTTDIGSGVSSAAFAWQTATDTDYTEPLPSGESSYTASTHDRDTSGWPLPISGGHTSIEIESLCEQAQAASTENHLCICGLEWTVSGRGDNPPSGAKSMGGHKTSACATTLRQPCGKVDVNQDAVLNECDAGEIKFAELMREAYCAVYAAHPCGTVRNSDPIIGDESKPGGWFRSFTGLELGQTGGCLDNDASASQASSWLLMYRDRGLHLGFTGGSDAHGGPWSCSGNRADNDDYIPYQGCVPAPASKEPFTGTFIIVWAGNLTPVSIVSAMRSRRTAWVHRDATSKPNFKFSMHDEDDGRRRVPMGSSFTAADTDVHVVVEIADLAGFTPQDIEVWKADATNHLQVGSVACTVAPCTLDAVYTSAEAGGDVQGDWYAMLTDHAGADRKIVASPIRVRR